MTSAFQPPYLNFPILSASISNNDAASHAKHHMPSKDQKTNTKRNTRPRTRTWSLLITISIVVKHSAIELAALMEYQGSGFWNMNAGGNFFAGAEIWPAGRGQTLLRDASFLLISVRIPVVDLCCRISIFLPLIEEVGVGCHMQGMSDRSSSFPIGQDTPTLTDIDTAPVTF